MLSIKLMNIQTELMNIPTELYIRKMKIKIFQNLKPKILQFHCFIRSQWATVTTEAKNRSISL